MHRPRRRRSLWRVSSPHTDQYGRMVPESWSLRGHPDLHRAMSSEQVGSFCCAERCLCRQSALAGSSETISATKNSVRQSSSTCVLSGATMGALESVSAVYRCLPATCLMVYEKRIKRIRKRNTLGGRQSKLVLPRRGTSGL